MLPHNSFNSQDVILELYVPCYNKSLISLVLYIEILKYKEIRRFYKLTDLSVQCCFWFTSWGKIQAKCKLLKSFWTILKLCDLKFWDFDFCFNHYFKNCKTFIFWIFLNYFSLVLSIELHLNLVAELLYSCF